VDFVDEDGSILVPRTVRPIVEYDETSLGNRKQALKQYRYKNLHIREYLDYYAVHMDKIDPMKDPIGHLVVDAPEYLATIAFAASCFKAAKNLIHNFNSE
jgi:hypothetical protein